jgi:hypothetical protein
MEPKTLAALNRSIEHWQRMSEGKFLRNYVDERGMTATMEAPGASDCALCSLFLNQRTLDIDHCVGCPVSEYTKAHFCMNTPYGEANSTFNIIREQQSPEFFEAAKKELAFLRSLLPKSANET